MATAYLDKSVFAQKASLTTIAYILMGIGSTIITGWTGDMSNYGALLIGLCFLGVGVAMNLTYHYLKKNDPAKIIKIDAVVALAFEKISSLDPKVQQAFVDKINAFIDKAIEEADAAIKEKKDDDVEAVVKENEKEAEEEK